MQAFKQLPGFHDGEQPRGCATIKNFKGSFARVTVTRCDAVKCRVINFRCPLKRADNQRPGNLQCTRVALCKSSTGKVGSYDWQLFAGKLTKIVRHEPNFLQLCRNRGDRFTNFRETPGIRIGYRRAVCETDLALIRRYAR